MRLGSVDPRGGRPVFMRSTQMHNASRNGSIVGEGMGMLTHVD